MSRRLRTTAPLAALILTLAACADGAATPTAPPRVAIDASGPVSAIALPTAVSVVMTQLDAPRGLEFGPEGALYVVEAGEAGYDANACVATYQGSKCFSGTGAVSRLWQGRQERVASGLPSYIVPTLGDIGGPQDIGFVGRGNAIVSIGWGGSPDSRDAMAALVPATGHALGTLIQLAPSGGWRSITDIAAFERTNAGGGFQDSNPYGLLAEPGVRYIADAGANTVVRADADGSTSLVAVFPPTPISPQSPFHQFFPQYEAVPTEVERGPDGALWVSTLSGAPFLPGTAAIWRVVPGDSPVPVVTGLTQAPDFDVASDGTVWVTRYGSAPFFGGPSALERIAPDGTRTTYIFPGLVRPTGVVAGDDGAVYVANRGSEANVGEVLRIVP